MKYAFISVPKIATYPYAAIHSGLCCLGYTVSEDPGVVAAPNSLLATWTPWSDSFRGSLFERARGLRIVFENGYIPRDQQGNTYYAVGRDGFNGVGGHYSTGHSPKRWLSFGLSVAGSNPYDVARALIVGQSAGSDDIRYTMPRLWPKTIAGEIRDAAAICYWNKRADNRYVPDGIPLDHRSMPTALKGYGRIYTWNSKRACEALLHGQQVHVSAPNSIIAALLRQDVSQFFYDLAHHQYTADEIATGYAFSEFLP